MSVAKYSTQNDPSAIQVIGCDRLARATSATLTAAHSDQPLINTGAVGQVDLTLPAAVVNLNFKMRLTVAQKFQFLCAGSDKILWQTFGTPGSNVRLFSSELGATIEIECLVAGIWYVVNFMGSWEIDV